MSKNLANVPLAPTVAALPKASKSIPVQIPAAVTVNGQIVPSEVPVTFPGSNFYVRVCSAPVSIATTRAGNVGIQNSFGNAQGQNVSGGFETLQVFNYNLFPVVALIWVGFEDFINNQFVISNSVVQNVTNPTQPTPGATAILIPDLSGTQFTDINGKKWYALARNAVIVSNLDSGVTLLLQKFNSVVANGAAVLMCPPALPVEHQSGGNFALNLGGAGINAIVSEIYQAFAA